MKSKTLWCRNNYVRKSYTEKRTAQNPYQILDILNMLRWAWDFHEELILKVGVRRDQDVMVMTHDLWAKCSSHWSAILPTPQSLSGKMAPLSREMRPGRFTFLDMAKMDNDGDFPGPAVEDRIRLLKFAVLCPCMSLFCVVNKMVSVL